VQVRGSFPGLNDGFRQKPAKEVKPASRSGNATRSLQRESQQTAINPKRRRQLTQNAPSITNPFGKLQGLVGKALRG
jgi:hypothetical protein